MTRTGGLREWFKGNGTNCLRIIPNSAVKFVTYQELSRFDPVFGGHRRGALCALCYYDYTPEPHLMGAETCIVIA